jgi:hypothetical protein
MDCSPETLGANCTDYEYGDTVDIMGSSTSAHYNAFQKERLGWLNNRVSTPILTVERSGTYILNPFESVESKVICLKILKSVDPDTGYKTWYYVEYRQPIGFDSYLSGYGNVTNGILVHYGTEFNLNSSYLLDMNPGTGESQYWEWQDPALIEGQSFHDHDAGMTLTVDRLTGSEAAVTVTMGTSEPTGGAPVEVGVSLDQPTYTLNQFVFITATVQSGGVPIENIPVNFIVTYPTGAFGSEAATDENGIAVYKFRLKRQDQTGLYTAEATVSNGSAISSGSSNSSASIPFTVY